MSDDPNVPLLRGLSEEMEYLWLEPLLHECITFGLKWKQMRPYNSDASADAIVAILKLESAIVERRKVLLLILDEESIPF